MSLYLHSSHLTRTKLHITITQQERCTYFHFAYFSKFLTHGIFYGNVSFVVVGFEFYGASHVTIIVKVGEIPWLLNRHNLIPCTVRVLRCTIAWVFGKKRTHDSPNLSLVVGPDLRVASPLEVISVRYSNSSRVATLLAT